MAQNGALLMTGRRRALMEALLAGVSVKDAAGLACISRRTAVRYLGEPAFQEALHAAETELIDAGMHRLLALQGVALDRLAEMLAPDAGLTPAERVRAVSLALNGLLRLRELRGVEERVAELEARLGALGGGP